METGELDGEQIESSAGVSVSARGSGVTEADWEGLSEATGTAAR